MKQLLFFDEASEEVEEARRWYRQRSESAEESFLRELDHAISQVVEAPERWPAHVAGTRRYVFPTFPYSLVYFAEKHIVAVVAVAHEKRKPAYWRKRLLR
jgi:plasmid stabilization system protein ParE